METSLARWFDENGLSGELSFRHALPNDGGMGYGLYSKYHQPPGTGSEDDTIAVVPHDLLLNAQTVFDYAASEECPSRDLLQCLQSMLEDDDCGIDERRVLLVFLLWQRFGSRSQLGRWQTYVNILPADLTTPIFYGPPEDTLLNGTGLEDARKAKIAKLLREYTAMVPHLRLMESEPTLDDLPTMTFERFKWADGIFWSRVISFHSSLEEVNEETPDYHLVPFVDFANHHADAKLRWQINESGDVELRLTRTGSVEGFARDEQLFISYGNKPNSELVFIHGFSIPDNPEDSVVLQAPFIELAADDDDDTAQASLRAKKLAMGLLGIRPIIELKRIEPDIKPPTLDAAMDKNSLVVLLLSVSSGNLSPSVSEDHSVFIGGSPIEGAEELIKVYDKTTCSELYQQARKTLIGLVDQKLAGLQSVGSSQADMTSAVTSTLVHLRNGQLSILELWKKCLS
ncbi:hypothetical protein HK405_012965 [Cladochytrium tenue]|nr:hypothetical protein HK405_012965 [Cladochytrium tenue]